MRRAWPVLILVASIAALLLVREFAQPSSLDLLIYRAEGAAVRSGANLFDLRYGPPGEVLYRATYPPFAAMLFVPLSYLPLHLVVALGLIANVALLAGVIALTCRLVGVGVSPPLICGGVAALLWMEPVYTTLQNGQINLLLLALVLWDFTRPPTSRLAGAGIGLAAAVKVTPAIFIGYLLLTRRLRAAAVAAATFAGALLFSALVLPDTTWRFWTDLVLDPHRVGRIEKVANQSVRGLLVRLDHTRDTAPGEFLLVALLLLVGLGIAVLAYRRLGDAWGVPACGVTALLVSPISWTHHWVWCVPIAVLLWHSERRALPGLLVFWTFIVWAVPDKDGGHELQFDALQVSLSGWYVLFGLAFLAGTAIRALRRPDPIRPARPSAPALLGHDHPVHEDLAAPNAPAFAPFERAREAGKPRRAALAQRLGLGQLGRAVGEP